ncbi:hypothetical protein L3Q72_21100 [Vibrio sp. JC009]|uniref:rhodanese-like domain-containing protein n=1 Tax=Vibrio sp. JC009 TaxID=2912314 RepID=UPI0023AF5283|nr:rhodanese-like domain-containing protein [Vibrio sp. JC009]WED23737.1 hypothetical protein L3Q72_21100 [Vibrio sp. JC009]
MEHLIREMDMQMVARLRVSGEQFVELYNSGEAILLDIRYASETSVWGFPVALEIPINELPDRLSEIPKDKIIICACPQDFRSNIACQYLNSIGFNAKVLVGGLLELTDLLRGGAASKLEL